MNLPGAAAALTIAFVVLKLTGYFPWDWFWAVSPVLIFLAFWVLSEGLNRFNTRRGP